MTARAAEWHLVGYDDDPIPASEWEIELIRDDMRQRSNDASEMRSTLESLANLEGWRGEAAEAFAEKADEVIGDLGNVVDRYDRLADALTTWADAVNTARDATWSAVEDAEAANEAIRSNPEHTGDGKPPDNQDTLDAKRENGEDGLAAAKTAMQNAMIAFEEAARKAKGEIEDAADVWDDGWWGDFKGWIRDNADVIAKIVQVLEIAGMILGAVILVLAIVASAPFSLVLIAAGLGLLTAVLQTGLVLADTGKASWGDVAWSLAGVAAALGGTKLASMAARGLTRVAGQMAPRIGAAARTSALSRLVGNSRVQFQNALRIQNPGNNLARWAQGMRSTATAEGNAAMRAVQNATDLQPTRVAAILAQDKGIAGTLKGLNALRGMGPNAAELAQINRTALQAWGGIGANSVGTAIWGKDLPKNIGGLVTNPPWSTQPAK